MLITYGQHIQFILKNSHLIQIGTSIRIFEQAIMHLARNVLGLMQYNGTLASSRNHRKGDIASYKSRNPQTLAQYEILSQQICPKFSMQGVWRSLITNLKSVFGNS